MRSNSNPFNREKNERPLITLLVHTDSLEQEILSEESSIMAIINLTKLKLLKVVFTPTENAILKMKLANEGIEITQYEQNDSYISIKSRHFEELAVCTTREKNYKNFYNKAIFEGSKINKIDYILRDSYNYFILSKRDAFFSSSFKKQTDIEPLEVIDLIRILLINLEHFYIATDYLVDEWYYYLYRSKKLFNEYQFAWSVVVGLSRIKKFEDVFNQFRSLLQRLEFICRATDKTSYYALKPSNSETYSKTLYHFGYLIMLITGVFDDLAWIIQHLYCFSLEKEYPIIKIKGNSEQTKFYEQLKSKNIELYSYLIDNYTQNIIKMFYSIRNVLQHREYLDGKCIISGVNSHKNSVFSIPSCANKFIDLVSNGNKEDFGVESGLDGEYYIQPYLFVKKATEKFAEVVNATLSKIEWSEFLEMLTQEEVDKIYASKEKFENGIGKFLGWGVEPIYF